MRYRNVVLLPRERDGIPAQSETCAHGRALAGEGCPACGAQAGEPTPGAYAIEVDVRQGIPSLRLILNGQHVASRIEANVDDCLREHGAWPALRVTVAVRTMAEPNAATLAEWIVRELRECSEREAYNLGREHALNAASWVIDGNTSPAHVRQMIAWLDAGDSRADEYLPRRPDLSGEYADDPTPLSLAREITGDDDPSAEMIDVLADAYETGVSDHFNAECERLLRAAVED